MPDYIVVIKGKTADLEIPPLLASRIEHILYIIRRFIIAY